MPGPGSDRAERADLREELVQIEGFRDDVGDLTVPEVSFVILRRRGHEEHRHVPNFRIGADAVEDLDARESGHHHVEDEQIGVDLAHGLEDEGAIRNDDRLIGWLVIDRITQKARDGLVVLADDHDPFPLFHRGRLYLKLAHG